MLFSARTVRHFFAIYQNFMRWKSVIAAVAVMTTSYMVHAGGVMSKVVVERRPFHKVRVAYVKHVGPYKDTWNEISVVETGLQSIKNDKLSDAPCFGIFYDDPRTVPAAECRSIVGKVITDDLNISELEGISVAEIPEMSDTLQVRYPFRGMISILVAIQRVYPAITRFWAGDGVGLDGTAIAEFYGLEPAKILFVQGVGSYQGLMKTFPE